MISPRIVPQDLGRKAFAAMTVLFLAYMSGNFFSNAWAGFTVRQEWHQAYDQTEMALATPTPLASCTPTPQATVVLSAEGGNPDSLEGEQESSGLLVAISLLIPSATPSFTPTATFTPTPTETPLAGSQDVSEIDGMINVYIPGGEFKMGLDAENGVVERADQPAHRVTVDDFWINLTPVTNAMYARCVEAGGCELPIRAEINPHYYDPAYANHPAVYVVWSKAAAYCAWAGGRLPSEAEWERAASGDGNRDYAWGDHSPRPELANVDNYHPGTTEVGIRPEGASPYGVLDMGSNVREWVNDWFDDSYYLTSPDDNPQGPDSAEKKVLRGASWHDSPSLARATSRLAHVPDSAGDNRGFRCAFD